VAIGLLFGCDQQVAAVGFAHCAMEMTYDSAVGLMQGQELVGSVIFQHYNGFNIEGSYYGKETLTPGVVKCLARYLVTFFDVARVTVVVSKRNKQRIRALIRFGFRLEGTQRCYYGKQDCIRNTGVRLVMFRDRLEQLAKLPASKAA
jgi:RimJ/RimL family protein N-acetyltransferase